MICLVICSREKKSCESQRISLSPWVIAGDPIRYRQWLSTHSEAPAWIRSSRLDISQTDISVSSILAFNRGTRDGRAEARVQRFSYPAASPGTTIESTWRMYARRVDSRCALRPTITLFGEAVGHHAGSARDSHGRHLSSIEGTRRKPKERRVKEVRCVEVRGGCLPC